MKPAHPEETAARSAAPDACANPERYRVFVEDVADGFYETDLRGNFTYFNDGLCRIFDLPPESIAGRNFREFMDADNARRAYESFNELYRSGGHRLDIEWEIVRRGGERRVLDPGWVAARDGLIVVKPGRYCLFSMAWMSWLRNVKKSAFKQLINS